MSDMRCATCYLLISACRCAKLDRCADCNGVIVEGFCDCDDVREDFDEDDEDDDGDCDCVFCREDKDDEDFDNDFDCCDDPDCDICN